MERENNLLFPKALKKARKAKKMTQDDLAQRIGTSGMSVRRYESGKSLPLMGTLGLICIALNDDSLLEAWTNSSVGICNEEQSRKDRVPWHNTYVRAKGAVSKQYWQNIVQNGRMPFIELLVETAKIYESMNRRGIRQAIDTIQYLAKVPEFQAEELWAYRSDVPGTTTTNGNEESKNE